MVICRKYDLKCTENSNDSTKNLLEIRNSEKLLDTKWTYKNQWHFHTLTTKHLKKKQKKPIPFPIALKQWKT